MSQVHWMLPQYSNQKALCYCDTHDQFYCYKELLDAIIGETMKLTVYADLNSTLLVGLSTLHF